MDLNQCRLECSECIKAYVQKHRLKKGETFQIPCKGIPKQYIEDKILTSLGGDSEIALSMVDPVTWARKFLDWHCLDPDGSIWKRKSEEGTLGELPIYNEYQAKAGKSIFHRPYQSLMLRCRSKRKVFRCGRQIGKSETLCIAMLHGMFTNSNFKIVVIAPFQAQIDLVFGRLVQLIRANTVLSNSVIRNVKAPNYTVELKNGSRVIGFTAGSRSGQGAASARGQSATMLIFDECDYLVPDDVDAALAIITNYPEATVWMSSTPTGRRERFYETCLSRLFREFHYVSHVNPNWTEELDNLYKGTLTEDGYKHEILGEFGEQEEGVYQVKYVELAQDDYEYKNMTYQKEWQYTIGVDWNDTKIGVTIAVVGYNPAQGLFYVVDKKIVSRSEYTQLKGCETVADYNRVWKPFSIYVDKGFGTTSIEVLRKFGYDSIATQGKGSVDSRLAYIVKPYDFGGAIETHDLFTKEPIKKAAKAFLVENSVRRFEQCRMRYPKSDEVYTKALLGYIVKRMSQAGVPIYEQQNMTAGDHLLDAVNLALVAFILEKTEFGKPKFNNDITFSSNLGLRVISGDGISQIEQRTGAEDHRPKLGRASEIDKNNTSGPIFSDQRSIPGTNMNNDSFVKLWSWPGFLRDEPKPQVRNLRKAFKQASERVYGPTRRGRSIPPKRNKF